MEGGGLSITLNMLDKMLELMEPWDGGSPRAFVLNARQYRKVTALACASGCALQFMPDPVLGKNLLHYMGVPLLVDNFISNGESDGEFNNRTSVYLVYMGARSQEPLLGGLVWSYKEDLGPAIRRDGPHRKSDAVDVFYTNLELVHGIAALGRNAVCRTRHILGTA